MKNNYRESCIKSKSKYYFYKFAQTHLIFHDQKKIFKIVFSRKLLWLLSNEMMK
jgi:hypothetical protein